MLSLDARVKKWGNSLGILLPREAAAREGLAAGQRARVLVIPQVDLTEWFGRGKGKIKDIQRAKNEVRRGWDP